MQLKILIKKEENLIDQDPKKVCKFIFSIVIFFVVSCSCNADFIYSNFQTISQKGWHKDSIKTFNFTIKDSITPHHIFIILRNNSDYKFENIFLIASLKKSDGMIVKDTFEYQMADFKGNWLGRGYTDIKTSRLFYKERAKFSCGSYQISLQQAVRQRDSIKGIKFLKGITHVGIEVSKNKN